MAEPAAPFGTPEPNAWGERIVAKRRPPQQDDLPYWQEARRPFSSLALLVPLTLVYEAALWWLSLYSASTRMNALHAWLDQALSMVGLGALYLCPLVGIFILFCWHVAEGYRWRVSGTTLVGVLVEATGFACLLVLCDRVFISPWLTASGSALATQSGTSGGMLQHLVLYIGAGIYEETVFRLILLPLILWGLLALAVPRHVAAVGAILLSALAFSAVHHVGPLPYPFNWPQFLFRVLAGVYFGGLFMARGFMVAVGAHAGFNLISGVLLPILALC